MYYTKRDFLAILRNRDVVFIEPAAFSFVRAAVLLKGAKLPIPRTFSTLDEVIHDQQEHHPGGSASGVRPSHCVRQR
jgi:hypothetical protein